MDELLLVGGAVLLYFFYTKGSTLANLVFQVQSTNFDIGNPLSPKVLVDVLVSNPTSGSLTLSSLAGYFYINGAQSGTVSFFQLATIFADAQTLITLTLSINDFALAADIVKYATGQMEGLTIEIKATANINNIPAPVDITFTPVAA